MVRDLDAALLRPGRIDRKYHVGYPNLEVRDPLRPRVADPHRRMWYRAIDQLPDDPALHRYLLAYASDFSFLGTAMDPHGVSWLSPGMQVASLDHVMWFHRPFRFDDWLLYTVDSPSASGGRGLVRGQFFDRAGRLVASAAQEGLIRRRQQGLLSQAIGGKSGDPRRERDRRGRAAEVRGRDPPR